LKYRVILRPQAETDVRQAREWYESKRLGLGRDFLDGVQGVIAGLAKRPLRYPVVYRNVRRALLRRFPYGVFYSVTEAEVFVVACFHSKRNPSVLVDRAR
jgi:plasmid stabilization system protein ParE